MQLVTQIPTPVGELQALLIPKDIPTIIEGDPNKPVSKIFTKLTVDHIRNGRAIGRRIVYNKKFTTAGRDFLIDAFQNLTELELMRFHDSGTGVVAESNADTGLGTPAGPARVSGTQVENGSNTYRTVATIAYTATLGITEHGIFSASTGGTLLDRTVFTVINVVSGDSIQFTFDMSVSAEA